MLSNDDLKRWLQRELSRAEKLLIVISSFEAPVKIIDIKRKAESCGCKMTKWNVADILTKAKGIAIKLPAGYEVGEKGHERLQALGIGQTAAIELASDLRKHLEKIKDESVRLFVDEAIKCYEYRLYRSAIVMGWIGAVAVLHREVLNNHLDSFNDEMRRIDQKWRSVKTADDFGRMTESDFLDRIAAISVVGKNVKGQLKEALNLRNGCGHPNSLMVGAHKTASHIETLLQNVFEKFAV